MGCHVRSNKANANGAVVIALRRYEGTTEVNISVVVGVALDVTMGMVLGVGVLLECRSSGRCIRR